MLAAPWSVQPAPRPRRGPDAATIFTTWGWKRHGDLVPGDYVFGLDGKPKRILAVTEKAAEESYEVVFDDGVKIIAGTGHLWEVERDCYDETWVRTRRKEVVTTRELTFGERKD